MIGGRPVLWSVKLNPAASNTGANPTVTTDGGDLHITSATGNIYLDGNVFLSLANSTFIGATTTVTSVFSAGITVNGAAGVFNAGLTVNSGYATTINGPAYFTNGVSISGGFLYTLAVNGPANFYDVINASSSVSVATYLAAGSYVSATSYISTAGYVYAAGYVTSPGNVTSTAGSVIGAQTVQTGGYWGYNIAMSGDSATPSLSTYGGSNVPLKIYTKGTGAITFASRNGGSTQFRIGDTTSTANYFSVYGDSSSNPPVMACEGSDTNISGIISTKGTSPFAFYTGYLSRSQFLVTDSSGTNQAYATGGTAPAFGSLGGDLQLLPASTYLQIGQTFAAATTPSSFSASLIWTIKDVAGNTRYVPVATATW